MDRKNKVVACCNGSQMHKERGALEGKRKLLGASLDVPQKLHQSTAVK